MPTATKWLRVSKRNRCPVCDKPDWCLLSEDGKAAICARIESGKPAGNKGAGWLHKLDTARPLPPLSKPIQDVKQTPKAPPDMLDMAYSALLAELQLSETHRQNLQRRGLTDAEIDSLGYRTLPASGRRELVNRLQAVKLAGVPGFHLSYIFTYERTWQKHLERRLGLKPVMDNGFGGKEYQLPKGLIPMPRAKRQYSEQTKKKMAARLARIRGRQKPLL